MDTVISGSGEAWSRRTARSTSTAQLTRVVLLLTAVVLAAWVSLSMVGAESRVPLTWPAAGLAAGMLLVSPSRWRSRLVLATTALLLGAFLAHGYDVATAVGFSLSSVATAYVVRRRLVSGREGHHVALEDQGDVSRLIGAAATGSLVAGLGFGLTAWATGHGNPWLGALAAFATHAGALMTLLPLFIKTVEFEALAGVRERALQLVITLGTTVAVFLFTDAPPVVFAVMPMFAWHAFRGTLREATLLLTVVGVVGTGLTMMGIGPLYGLEARYGLAPEVVSGVLQLFLMDCGLILMPLSVMVTQQRMAAVRADSERETLQRLVGAATGTAVIALGHDGRVSLFNPGAEAMLGREAGDVEGTLPDALFAPTELMRQAAAVHALPNFADICRASVEVQAGSALWQLRRPDGEERTLRMTLTAVPDERGQRGGYLVTAEDATEREAAHRALLATLEHERNAMDQLRDLERVKGDFVATVSHELRTPITSIMGYTEVLEDGAVGELTGPQLEILGRVDRNTRRLLLLVEDLLTLSKIEASTLKIEPTDIDLADAVRRAHGGCGELLAGRLLDVDLDLPPAGAAHCGDAAQLQRMVHGLLTNAVKFTPDGGRVGVRLSATEDGWRLVVTDTGMGIPKSEQARLFTRFFRSSTAYVHAIQGSGLGLTIVRAIVTLHGGDIAVSSVEREGTTVTVNLPRSLASYASGVA